ncbi:unnamed protein product [Tetraodon nigroviridis]|uniref:(spotted green pufferfish) hypothetical protein n=1 Tax=Tetraodon nigroviridis TaxID=99883 RepID=Q4RJM5_TETNG|nr:unnamed protein product [Tetraodon nigroviridis]
MCELRQQALQLETKRQKKQRNCWAQAQNLQVQAQTPVLSGLEAVNVESDEEEDDMSMDSLRKRSGECVKKAQSQQGSGVPADGGSPTPQPESEKKRPGAVVEFGFSLQHSPVGPPPSPPPRPQPPHHHAHLPPSGSSSSPQRRRPRPVSTGNIHISFPIGPADLIPRSPGRSGPGAGGTQPSFGVAELTTSADVAGVGRSGDRVPNPSGASPKPEPLSPTGASAFSPKERRDHVVPGFRRRCHTLDSQTRSAHSRAEHVDRSQERVPRFMAGVTWMPASRRSPAAPLGQTYKVEKPSPPPLRPDVPPLQDYRMEETQRTVQGLEDMQRRLEEEHALRMSLLQAEQEKAQQRLHVETERSLMVQNCVQQMSGDGCGWICRSTSDGGHTVLTPEQQRAFCRIGALIRGFLTRRLLRTEKLKHLCQTVLDTQEFIRSFQTEAQNRDACSAQDHSLQQRVRAQVRRSPSECTAPSFFRVFTRLCVFLPQLRAALYDIYDIFFVMPLGDRLTLLQQDRELRAERKLREMRCRLSCTIEEDAAETKEPHNKQVAGTFS